MLAFWLGSVATDAKGDARRRREAAGVADDLSDHGGGRRPRARGSDRRDTEIRVNKPLMLKPTFPRFLAVGDTAQFGAVVTSQLPAAGAATVVDQEPRSRVLEFGGTHADRRARLAAGGSIEVRFAPPAGASGGHACR